MFFFLSSPCLKPHINFVAENSILFLFIWNCSVAYWGIFFIVSTLCFIFVLLGNMPLAEYLCSTHPFVIYPFIFFFLSFKYPETLCKTRMQTSTVAWFLDSCYRLPPSSILVIVKYYLLSFKSAWETVGLWGTVVSGGSGMEQGERSQKETFNS